MSKKGRKLLAVMMTLAFLVSTVVPVSAVSFSIPTAPIDTQDNVIKTTATRAGQIAPLILGCNLVSSSNLGASQDDYNKVTSILGVFGSAINDKPDPYLYNFNYNYYAKDHGLPVVENATIATEQQEGGGSDDPNALIQAELVHRPDLCLTQRAGTGSNTEFAGYADVIATFPENSDTDTTNDYNPSYYSCSISTLVYQCENLINLSKVVKEVCEAKNLTTRYNDPYEIATDYDKYVWGHYFYVQKMLDEKKIGKKKVAVVGSTSDSGATWQLPAVGTAVDQQKPNRLVEYARDNTDLLNTTEAGTASVQELMDCDVVIANRVGDQLRNAAAAAGVDEDDLPLIIDSLPTCLYGMIMQTHENALGIPYFQSIIYGPELELNPVYAAAYFYQHFFHITDEEALQETVNTLLSTATLPAGTTTSISSYDPENVEDIIIQGMDYAKENGLKRHDDTEAWDPDRTVGIGSEKPVKVDFEDVKDTDYFADAVAWAVTKDVTKGTSEKTFSPGEECTRAQMVTFMYRAAGSPAVTAAENPFKDVKEGSYYYNAVLWAVDQKITKGMTAETFGPDAKVSRGQAVTFLYRMDGEKKVSAENPFTDVAGGAYYTDAVLWAVDQKITNGMSDTAFQPGTTCQRAHIVTFLYRYLG